MEINIKVRELQQRKMEEVGKYESIQDRIKRLTKNQASCIAAPVNEKLDLQFVRTPPVEDSQKQNMSRMNFAKQRQNSQNNLRTLTTTRQYTTTDQRPFDLITNMLGDNSHPMTKYSRTNQFRKTSNQYAIRKPTRESFQESDNQWDSLNYSMKRNDSVGGNLVDRSGSYMMDKYSVKKMSTEFDQGQEISFLHDGNKENRGIKRAPGIKKTQPNTTMNNRQQSYGDMSYRRSMDDSGLTKMIKCHTPQQNQQYVFQRKLLTENLPTQNCNKQLQITEIRSRMITRCNSGILSRVPGKIIKNR